MFIKCLLFFWNDFARETHARLKRCNIKNSAKTHQGCPGDNNHGVMFLNLCRFPVVSVKDTLPLLNTLSLKNYLDCPKHVVLPFCIRQTFCEWYLSKEFWVIKGRCEWYLFSEKEWLLTFCIALYRLQRPPLCPQLPLLYLQKPTRMQYYRPHKHGQGHLEGWPEQPYRIRSFSYHSSWPLS